MKKIAFLSLLFLVVFSLGAADLSSDGKIVKEHLPNAYELIKERAVEEWGTDYTMVLYVINQQCEGLLDALGLIEDNWDELIAAMCDWTDGGIDEIVRITDAGVGISDCPADWTMVVYVARQQIEAKGKY